MSDQTKISTAGPEDPKAPNRAKGYAVVSGLLGLLPALVAFNILTKEQAASLIETYGALTGLAGAFGLGIASYLTNKQVKNGTFDPPPPPVEVPVLPPPLSPAEKITSAVEDARNTVEQVSNGLGQIRDIVGVVPGLVAASPDLPGPLDDLIRGAAERMKQR